MQSTHSDNSGTTVQSASQNLGEPARTETRRYDSHGRELQDGGTTANRRIEDVSDEEQAQRDREYEERIEDE